MDPLQLMAHHGYTVLAAVMLLASIGVPLPVGVALLLAGAASHHDLRLGSALGVAFAASFAGDTLLYLGGRYTGWWLLSGMCRLSMNPERCIFSSAEYFYRRGPKTLLVAKFVPGLGALAAPLAGSLNMRYGRFLRLDAAGTALYVAAWTMAGYVFAPFLREITRAVERASHAFVVVLVLLLAGYLVTVLVAMVRDRRFGAIERIGAATLQERLAGTTPDRLIVIADVRSHNYYDPGMQRIKNSIRVEPHRLKEEVEALREFMAPECEIYLYCSCLRDTTSVRVAHMLREENCAATVIEGGIKAWVKAGGALEPVPPGEIRHLPRFE